MRSACANDVVAASHFTLGFQMAQAIEAGSVSARFVRVPPAFDVEADDLFTWPRTAEAVEAAWQDVPPGENQFVHFGRGTGINVDETAEL